MRRLPRIVATRECGTDQSSSAVVAARRAALAAVELRDEPVAVAAVDRAYVLDDLTRAGLGRPLEEKGGRGQRTAEGGRFLLVRDRRFDRLHARCDDDPVALLEELVEGVLLQIPRRQPRDQRL